MIPTIIGYMIGLMLFVGVPLLLLDRYLTKRKKSTKRKK